MELTQRETFVLEERRKQRTLESIGKELGITRERVRQIENVAKKKLNKIKARIEELNIRIEGIEMGYDLMPIEIRYEWYSLLVERERLEKELEQ